MSGHETTDCPRLVPGCDCGADRCQKPTDRDVMQDAWCCLTCYAKFQFGKLRMGPTGLMCPVCRSENTAAADGRVYDER